MPIETTIDETGRLTIHAVSGEPTLDEYIETVEIFYKGSPTLNEIWDFRKANIHGYSKQNMRIVAFTIRLYADARKGGKTVFLPPEDRGLKVLELLEVVYGLPFRQTVCSTMEEAQEWLFGNE